jgi:hypothetical protein
MRSSKKRKAWNGLSEWNPPEKPRTEHRQDLTRPTLSSPQAILTSVVTGTPVGYDAFPLLNEVSMWICLNDAFLSIVTDTTQPDHLLVRARRRGDIERVFEGALVSENTGTDYRYRTCLPRTTVASTVTARIANIDYPNFKSSVTDTERHAAYFHLWGVMYRYQENELRSDEANS